MADEQPQTDWQSEHVKLQAKLDAVHQELADLKVAHAAELDGLRSAHDKQIVDLVAAHNATLAAKQADLEAINQAHHDGILATEKQHAAEIEALKAAHDKHDAEVKASVLVPALNDLHARQQADLAAKHRAELDALASR